MTDIWGAIVVELFRLRKSAKKYFLRNIVGRRSFKKLVWHRTYDISLNNTTNLISDWSAWSFSHYFGNRWRLLLFAIVLSKSPWRLLRFANSYLWNGEIFLTKLVWHRTYDILLNKTSKLISDWSAWSFSHSFGHRWRFDDIYCLLGWPLLLFAIVF